MSVLQTLVAQRVRRDRFQLPVWIVGTGLLALVSAVGVANTYGDDAARTEILSLAISSPAILLLRGLPQGGGLDAFVFFEIFTYLALLAGLMSTFLAVRHTRAEEESGRAELVGSTLAGRTLPTVATILHGLAADVLLGIAVWLGMLAGGLDLVGSLVTGVASAAVGASFLGVGLLASQVMRTSRGANAVSVGFVGLAFVLRGVGDAMGTRTGTTELVSAWPSWLSPIGWAQHTGAYTTDTLVPLLLNVLLAAVSFSAVLVLQGRRDSGSSLVPAKRSRATASALLSGPLGLAWRLHGPAVAGWAIGGAAFGLLAGTLTGLVEQASAADPAIVQTLGSITGDGSAAPGRSTTEALIGALFTIVGALAAGSAVQAIMRVRQEEASGTAELLLAAPVSRMRLLAGYVVLGSLATLTVLATAAVVALLGLSVSGQSGDLSGEVVATALAQLPAALLYLGIGSLFFVVLPRATITAGWSLLALGIVLGIFGALIGVPDWLRDLSPFTHTPTISITGGTTDWSGGVWMFGVAIGVVAASFLLMRRRELTNG